MRRAAVLGHPISHSQSPLLHAAAYEHLGLDIDYRRIDVPLEGLGEFLGGAGSDTGWLGWSVTMPLKSALVAVVARPSARVQALGVLNTVVHRRAEGSEPVLHGENTDVDGIVHALGEAGLHRGSSREELTFGIIGAEPPPLLHWRPPQSWAARRSAATPARRSAAPSCRLWPAPWI